MFSAFPNWKRKKNNESANSIHIYASKIKCFEWTEWKSKFKRLPINTFYFRLRTLEIYQNKNKVRNWLLQHTRVRYTTTIYKHTTYQSVSQSGIYLHTWNSTTPNHKIKIFRSNLAARSHHRNLREKLKELHLFHGFLCQEVSEIRHLFK